MKKDKESKDDFFDDGRVIADMSIDGMPGSLFRKKLPKGTASQDSETEDVRISKSERKALMRGVAASYILFGLIFFSVLALFILFCTKVWFK